jgi:hypothetical protein
MSKTLTLHLKILTSPYPNTLETMRYQLTQLYALADIVVDLASTQTLDVSDAVLALLNDIDTGTCNSGAVSEEQVTLSNYRDNAGPNDVVVYACRTVSANGGALNGCASYPPGRPMAVISAGASVYTLAHEIGHVLGLVHVNDNDRLMTGNGTYNITNPPPDLTAGEITIMNISPYVH